ncbi:MAG: DUF1467 family protein [Alphaproteobacteria bacterium]|nr:DUF1467 family protein [Alphaproteobacteria bacterium SS10]
MDWFSGLVVFLLIWWTALFTVLPLWVRRNDESVEGVDPGAPEHPYLLRKAIVTTALSGVLWLIVFILVEVEIISFHEIADRMFAADQVR